MSLMARLLLKIQRYFRRKPVRFFTFILLYLSAGSVVFLHAGFSTSGAHGAAGREPLVAVEGGAGDASVLAQEAWPRDRRTPDGYKAPRRFSSTWMRAGTPGAPEWGGRGGEYSSSWDRARKRRDAKELDDEKARYIGCYVDDTARRALRGVSFLDYKKMTVFRCQDNCAERGYLYAGLEFGAECYCGHRIQAPNASESQCNMECKGDKSTLCGGANRLSIYRLELSQESARRYGSAIFKGCFRRPDNITLALPASAVIQNMSVDKCVEMCTEKEFTLAVLAGEWCHCGFPTALFSLHEREDEEQCRQHCAGEEVESCGNDDYFIAYQTQVQDKRCMDRRFLPTRSKQLIALASFPGAGNTWMRHLIELATGYYTGSYYFDGALYNKGFKGERDQWRSGRTVCVKTHECGRREVEAFNGGILLIRNPYKALIAEFNRRYAGHTGFASQAQWKGKEWPEFLKNYVPYWASHTLNWLTFGRRVHVLHFEDLKRDLFVQLKGLVLFLGLEVSEDRLLCVEGQKDGNFKRSGLRKLDYDPYTAEMRTTIDSLIRTVDDALRKRKLPRIPEEYRPR